MAGHVFPRHRISSQLCWVLWKIRDASTDCLETEICRQGTRFPGGHIGDKGGGAWGDTGGGGGG